MSLGFVALDTASMIRSPRAARPARVVRQLKDAIRDESFVDGREISGLGRTSRTGVQQARHQPDWGQRLSSETTAPRKVRPIAKTP